ncbi:hypothetical protein PPERSA_03041 [Pseudocohnilembus persalinus]|uniref:Uncharacterized protein n=1 Tax=Pseudocohnilembus persalinus TaxID=266149 RepID=A0A0V0QF19_PSEPJ|nr:hypothetical protein PPERSA_03041 [Pseudocohnilembus persalinus]|eukprot:KRX00781.1 hypothetical protein PPERSA_03041 [Pseudocohnilembus persalinus]
MSDKKNENEFQVQELLNSYNKILATSFNQGQENPDFDKNFEILAKQIKKLCENKVELKTQYLGEQKCQICIQPFTYEEIQDYNYAEGQCGHKFHHMEFREYVLKCSKLLNDQDLKQKMVCPVKDCNQSLYETERGGIIDQVYTLKHFEDLRELKNPLQCIVCPNQHLKSECKEYFCDYCKNFTFYTIECRNLQIINDKEYKNANIQFQCNKCNNRQNVVKLIQKNEDIVNSD